jgi:hypothetical protein
MLSQPETGASCWDSKSCMDERGRTRTALSTLIWEVGWQPAQVCAVCLRARALSMAVSANGIEPSCIGQHESLTPGRDDEPVSVSESRLVLRPSERARPLRWL